MPPESRGGPLIIFLFILELLPCNKNGCNVLLEAFPTIKVYGIQVLMPPQSSSEDKT
jgi:hypothetical protein